MLQTFAGVQLSRSHHPSCLFDPLLHASIVSALQLLRLQASWPADSTPTELGRSLPSVSTSFSSLAATMTGTDLPLATEWCSCFHDGGFEQGPYRLHVIKFARRWKMKSLWTESSGYSQQTLNMFGPAGPVRRLPKNLIQFIYWQSRTISPACPE